MSKTSGVDAQVLALPSGGGAVLGLGTTFETDLNTGTGSYSIPLNLPAGPNGISPALSIRYASTAGNGPFGVGWTLGLMAIARRIEGRIPDHGPDDDAFTLVGVEDLVNVGGGRYRPVVDIQHLRILRSGDGWELTEVNGLQHELGISAQARIEESEAGLTRTAVWLLEAMTDTSGNRVQYAYRQDGAQRLIDHVTWGTYNLTFFYETRPDRVTTCRYGFLLETGLRCNRIELRATNLSVPLVRSWNLEYAQAAGGGMSLLNRVIMHGHSSDGTAMDSPPLTLRYTEAGVRTLQRLAAQVPSPSLGHLGGGRVELVDMDGDGLPDLLEMAAGVARAWTNRGRGRWGPPRQLSQVPAGMATDSPDVGFADMDGSGSADVVTFAGRLPGYTPISRGGGFGRPVTWSRAPSVQLSDARTRLVDLNGDGITDLMTTGPHGFTLYYRAGTGGWSTPPQTVVRGQAPPVDLSDAHVGLADINGDGIQDLVRVDGGGVTWWPYLGAGRWAPSRRLANPPTLPQRYDPARLFLVDVDGDGCADLVYVDVDRVLLWPNQSGTAIGEMEEIRYTPPAAAPAEVRLADMLGSGTAGVLWPALGAAARSAAHFFLDLSGGTKPYLLTGIDNGAGLVATIRYRASTEFAVDDADAGTPWRTFHPFPVQCVSEIQSNDLATGQVAVVRYRYHEGHYDAFGHAYLGFSAVDVETAGDADIPASLARNVFHVGVDPADPGRPVGDEERIQLAALRRKLLRTELYGLDGTPEEKAPFAVVRHEYDVQVEAFPGGSVCVPFETRCVDEHWERGAAPFAFREVTYANIDAYGNVGTQRVHAWRPGVVTPDQDVTTTVTFASNPTGWVVSAPARVTQRTADGTVVSVVISLYDGPSHTGLPEGLVTAGNLTAQESLALTDEMVTAVYGASPPDLASKGYHRRPGENGWWVTLVSYDRQGGGPGPVLISRGPRGFDTRMEWEPTGQYPLHLVDSAGNRITGDADQRSFQMSSTIDANGAQVRDLFDPLGRVTAVVKPGDSDVLPTTGFTYAASAVPASVHSTSRVTSGAPDVLDSWQYFSGQGELLQRIVDGEGDPGRQFLVAESLRYTVRGQIAARCFPYYVNSSDFTPSPAAQPAIRMSYDALGRLVRQNNPDGTFRTRIYGPGSETTLDETANAGLTTRRTVHRLDTFHRVTATEDHVDGSVATVVFEYDAASRPVRVVDAAGGETRMTYDLLGRLLAEQNADTGRSIYVVDAAGNQVQRTNGAGKTVRMTYDSLDRLRQVTLDGTATPELTYSYLDAGQPDPPDGVQNRRGRLWSLTDPVGTMSYGYDPVGRIIQTRRTATALPGQVFLSDLAYDALGRQTRVTLPETSPGSGRRVVDCAYNARGLPTASPSYVKAAEYDVAGHLTRLVYQNGVENRADFDALNGRPTRLRVTGPTGEVLRDQSLTFDAGGDLTRVDAPHPAESGSFTYDAQRRLSTASFGSGEHYSYTSAENGNLLHIDGVGDLAYAGNPGTTAVTSAGHDTYTYTSDGHMRTAPFGALEFDGLDNLVTVTLGDGRRIDQRWDHSGRRAVRQTSDGHLSLLVDASVEFHDGRAVLWVSFGGRRILSLTNGRAAWLHPDQLGTPTLFTSPDGAELRRLAFAPYGQLRSDSAAGSGPPGIRFTGQLLDDATGLLCLGRRFYDPRLGRFISPDRVIADLFSVDAWNRYLYAHGNPLRYSDPTGRFNWGEFFAIVAVIIVVAITVVAGIFTYGATWSLLGAEINIGGLLIGVAAGVAAGAVVGGIAAAKAGGDITAGILFGALVGGTTAFVGGVLGPVAGAFAKGLLGSLFGAIIGGAVQGAIIGAGTGAATGFAGGRGTAEQIWSQIWKGAIVGAITGAILGGLGQYLKDNVTYLHVGTLDKVNPAIAAAGTVRQQASFIDSAASLGEGISRVATTGSPLGLLSTFVDFGDSASESALLNINLSFVPVVLTNGGSTLITAASAASGDRVLFFVLEATPYVGTILTFFDLTQMGWYQDVKRDLNFGITA